MSRGGSGGRRYPRTARLNKLFQEILAEELTRIDDERVELVTVMDVDVDAELSRALVYFLVPDGDDPAVAGEALAEHRGRLQGALGSQARIRRVPELVFRADDVSVSAARIEAILAELPETREAGGDDEDAPDGSPTGEDGLGDDSE